MKILPEDIMLVQIILDFVVSKQPWTPGPTLQVLCRWVPSKMEIVSYFSENMSVESAG